MKNIIAFAGSHSSTSINKQLATYASTLIDNVNAEILDLNDYELPLYGVDLEEKIGIPDKAIDFLNKIKDSDGIIVSLAEHNGAYSTAFKNLYDWMSRSDGKLWSDKPMLLMATSPGSRGGASVLEVASGRFPRMGAQLISTFSLPSFNDNFSEGRIVSAELNDELLKNIEKFKQSL